MNPPELPPTPSPLTLQSLLERLTALEARHTEFSARNAQLENRDLVPSSVLEIHSRATEQRFHQRDLKLQEMEWDLQQATSKADYTALVSRVAQLENHSYAPFDMLEVQCAILEAKFNDLKTSYTTLEDTRATLETRLDQVEKSLPIPIETLRTLHAILEAKYTALESRVVQLENHPSTPIAALEAQHSALAWRIAQLENRPSISATQDKIHRNERTCPNCGMTGHGWDACRWNCTICEQGGRHMGMDCALLKPGGVGKGDDGGISGGAGAGAGVSA